MSRKLFSIGTVALLGTGIVAGLAYAAQPEDAEEDANERAAIAEAKMSLQDAIRQAEQKVPGGKVLESEVDTEAGVVSYVVDIEKDGAVQTVMIDVRTGEAKTVPQEADDRDEGGDEVEDNDGDEEEDD